MSFLSKLLGGVSGDNSLKLSDQLLFDKVVGFRNVVPGCGASTIIQNLAIALREHTNYTICVLDTNFLYPMAYVYLSTNEEKKDRKDMLEFGGNIAEIMTPTLYTNIYVVELRDRTIVDMLSGQDDMGNLVDIIESLKSYFDIVLVDLSNELTNIAVGAAVKCNKIYQVADTSLKCTYNLKKSMNLMATLAVPLAKANKVIINKQFENMNIGIVNTFKEVGLEIVGEIPFSEDIYKYSITGRKLYGGGLDSEDIGIFNSVIDTLLDDIVETTPLNAKYLDVKSILAQQEKQKEMVTKYGDQYVDTFIDTGEDSTFQIEEMGVEEYEELKSKGGKS